MRGEWGVNNREVSSTLFSWHTQQEKRTEKWGKRGTSRKKPPPFPSHAETTKDDHPALPCARWSLRFHTTSRPQSRAECLQLSKSHCNLTGSQSLGQPLRPSTMSFRTCAIQTRSMPTDCALATNTRCMLLATPPPRCRPPPLAPPTCPPRAKSSPP